MKVKKRRLRNGALLTKDSGDAVINANAFNNAMGSATDGGGMGEELSDESDDSIQLNETGLSRILSHTRDKNTFAVIGSRDKDTKESRVEELKSLVSKCQRRYEKDGKNIGWNWLEGTYTYENDGTTSTEDSMIVYNIDKEDALNVARKINQETIIWKDDNFFGFLTMDGKEDGELGRGLSFDKKKVKMFGSKLTGRHNNAKGFVFESFLVETDNIGSNFSKHHKVNIIRNPLFSIRFDGDDSLTEAPVKYVDYNGEKSRLYQTSKTNKKTGEKTTRYFVKDKDYIPLQQTDVDLNADVPDRVKFIAYKQFKSLYNPNDPSTEKYKGKLFPLFVGAKQKDGIEIGKWYNCGQGELRIEVDENGNVVPGGLIQVVDTMNDIR